jgi:hypothetical protein
MAVKALMMKAPSGLYDFRITHPFSDECNESNGAWRIKYEGVYLTIIASNGGGWEHVSVSRPDGRMPTWGIMQMVRELFWPAEACVVQYHPPASQHVNNVHNCLHLWRSLEHEFPMPDALMVGVKGIGCLTTITKGASK